MMSTPALPLVSVVIPVYNGERYIQESVESITRQTYEHLEILVIDDRSTDSTPEILKLLASRDSRIRVIAKHQNKGVGAARTTGIKLSLGKYICWQDADDISLPNRVAAQVAYLEAHPEVGVVGGSIEFFDATGPRGVRTYDTDDKQARSTIFRFSPVGNPVSMYRKSVFSEVGFYDDRLRVSEDLDMLFRVGERFQFGNVDEVLLRYRQVPTSLTRKKMWRMEIQSIRLRCKYARSSAYTFRFGDAAFLAAQVMLLPIPASLKIWLFQRVRGDQL